MAGRRSFRSTYRMPGIDSPQAKASATLFLTNARTLDDWSAERLARQYRLSLKVAEYLLVMALQRGTRG